MADFSRIRVFVVAVIIDLACLTDEGNAECDGLSGWHCRETVLNTVFNCDDLYTCASTHGCTRDELRLPPRTTCREIEACDTNERSAVRKCYVRLTYGSCSQLYWECLSTITRCAVYANFTNEVYCPGGVTGFCSNENYRKAKQCLEKDSDHRQTCSEKTRCLTDNHCEVLDILLPAECRNTATEAPRNVSVIPTVMNNASTTVSTTLPSGFLSRKLYKLKEERITTDSALNITNQLKKLTSDATNFVSEDIATTVEMIENVLSNMTTIEQEVGDNVLTSASQLLDASEIILLQTPDTLEILRQSLDTLGEMLIINASTVLDTPNLAMGVSEIMNIIGFGRADNDTIVDISTGEDDGQYRDSIVLPVGDICEQVANCSRDGNTTGFRVVYMLHKKTELFLPHLPASSVLSATVVGEKISDLQSPIVLTFTTNENFSTIVSDDLCVFYNTNAPASSSPWSSRGCRLANYSNQKITCYCNHTTDFALLLPPLASNVTKKATKILTLLGMSLSIPGLLFTLLSVLLVNCVKSHRQHISMPHIILSNLALALLLFYTTLLAGSIQIGKYLLCRIFSVTWGLPLVVVMGVAVVDALLVGDSAMCSETSCWPAPYQYIYVIYMVLVAVVIAINTTLYIVILYKTTCGRERMRNLLRSNQERSRFKETIGSLALFVVLGISWVFGLIAVGSVSNVFAIVFCVLNAFQGFFIFILHCVRVPDIRKAWIRILPCLGICCPVESNKSVASDLTMTSN